MRLTKTNLYITYLLLFVVLLSGSVLFNGCGNDNKANNSYVPTGDTVADGLQLAQKYCSSCHAFVPADQMIKDVWKFHTLPAMSHYPGLSTYGIQYFKNKPDSAGITLLEWQAIQTYYAKKAPAAFTAAKAPTPLLNDWAGFSIKKPAEQKAAFTTMIKVDPSTQKIYTSDYQASKLYAWDANLKSREVADLPSPGVNVDFVKTDKGRNALVTCVGELLPMDFPNGKLVSVDLGSKEKITKPDEVFAELSRPMQTLQGDFNKDGLTDLVVCAQGGTKIGGIYLLKQNPDHSYSQSTISKKPGVVQAIVGDFNNDGWPDIMALYRVGDEGLWLYLNDKKGGFTSRNLLHFSPFNGSSSFQLADMNGDGKPDLIYTCGYNFYDSRVLKPYHGLYIYTNQGDWNFKQSYFYPINGCTKAIAADFNGDGKTDIATIAFFADMKNNPAESFIEFEQDGPLSFKPHAIPVSQYGRWFDMDVADVNHDGKPDIVLANYSRGFFFQPGFTPKWSQTLPFIVLENHSKK